MQITILAVGKSKTQFLDLAIAEYEKRLSRYPVKVSWQVIPTSDKETESPTLLAKFSADSYVILLDERGKQWSTPAFAEALERLQNQSTKQLCFIIGGAHGVTDAVRARADFVWSLSELVFPHELVRLMLAEQLYRAYDLLAGGNYHHS